MKKRNWKWKRIFEQCEMAKMWPERALCVRYGYHAHYFLRNY